MKTAKRKKSTQIILKTLLTLCMLIAIPQDSNAQFFKKLKEKAKKKIEQEAEKRAERRMNKKIDKEFDKAEDVLDGKKKEKNKDSKEGNSKKNEKGGNNSESINSDEANAKSNKTTVEWSKFDFVPGDEVIFEDGPSTNEENGEFPSRWDAAKGNAEIVTVDGEPAIVIPQRMSVIVPYLKNSNEDYLPEVFTVEFDCYFKSDEPSTSYIIHLYDQKNQSKILASSSNKDNYRFKIDEDDIYEYSNGTNYKYNGENVFNKGDDGIWRHISVAFTKGKLKIYMDEVRLLNIPHYPENPLGVSIETMSNHDKDLRLIKNFRIAKGGVKYYDRVLSEGKIIVNGIKFDVNKATLKAESMGPINEIFELMTKNPSINFSVEGHTDSDGGEAANMTLSIERGEAVMHKLVAMGIAANRLKSNGFGESKPIDNNSSPEGKANNRRVEFVKF
ncbi:OmpA family protein [Polaribacter sp.]|uniref:OmpA family protein n=1 Tax=Polaribacter sp. TaxID=1920175 RepID=UPI003EF59881